MKGLSAAAGSFCIGVVEHEFTFDLCVDIIHFHAYNEHQGLLVYEHSDVLVFYNLIQFVDFVIVVLVVHDIGISIAPSALHTEFDAPYILAAFVIYQLLDSVSRILSYQQSRLGHSSVHKCLKINNIIH